MDRVFGKADQFVEAKIGGAMTNLNVNNITPEKAREVYLALMNNDEIEDE